MDSELKEKTIVFFDGECLVCNRFVILLLNHSDKLDYYYAPLFGETFNKLEIAKHYLDSDSIALYKNETIFIHAQAIEIITKSLGGIYKFVSWGIKLCPHFISDFLYKLFARLRFVIFSRIETCALIPADQKSRLLP
ncbi:hypothetical protein A9Q84_10835 [Halobacteriovorax marinus]|uniref:Thiol-disulfide oxidoreductase n=1 Tax=Halobacteriovorax marinus TaxID=97084 RepID=A0A1Y5F7D6_9BACT|nr:hypothetical protein A9Q84_10835 [Halobacteriovorax marinus]